MAFSALTGLFSIFLPFFVALGAAGEGARGERIHASMEYGSLAMDAYRFG